MASIFKGKSKSKLTASGSSKTPSVKGKRFSTPILALLVVGLIILFGLVLAFFNNLNKTEDYYVLASDVPAHSQITTDELKKVTTKAGTAPESIKYSDVEQGTVYAQYDLLAGDVLTSSNTGGKSSLYNGISDSWAITSFTINSSDAVDGNITRGDYFDILALGSKASNSSDSTSSSAVSASQGGSYIYYNVLCLYTTNYTTSTTSKEGTTTTTGESLEYFVAMPPKDIALLQSAISSLSIKLVMSPRENAYQEPDAKSYNFATFNYNGTDVKPKNASLCDDSNKNSGDCTDNTFLDVKRNTFGVPYDATSSELNSNGDLKNPKKLTKAEKTWCTALFTDSYYLGSRWDNDKNYCISQGYSKTKATELQKAAKEAAKSSSDDSESSTDSSK